MANEKLARAVEAYNKRLAKYTENGNAHGLPPIQDLEKLTENLKSQTSQNMYAEYLSTLAPGVQTVKVGDVRTNETTLNTIKNLNQTINEQRAKRRDLYSTIKSEEYGVYPGYETQLLKTDAEKAVEDRTIPNFRTKAQLDNYLYQSFNQADPNYFTEKDEILRDNVAKAVRSGEGLDNPALAARVENISPDKFLPIYYANQDIFDFDDMYREEMRNAYVEAIDTILTNHGY